MGPAAAWIVPSVLGIGGAIVGANAQSHAADQASSAASQASAGQNALDQTLIGLYNNQLSDYQQNYQPLEGPLGQQFSSLLQNNPTGDLSSTAFDALGSPMGRDTFSGIPLQELTDQSLQYFFNPGGTLSGLNGVGGQALNQYLDPNTNLAQTLPGVESYFANPQNTNLAGMTPGAQDYFTNTQNKFGLQAGQQAQDYFGSPQDTNLQQVTPGVESYFGNTQGTNLARQTPGFQNMAMDPMSMVSGIGGVGGNALNFFQQQARQGLDPAYTGDMFSRADAASQRNINSLRNQLGAGSPNINGLISDLNGQSLQSHAQLAADLAGQNQQYKDSAMNSAFGVGQGIDQMQFGRALQGLQAGGQLDAQTAQMLSQIPQLAQGLDTQTAGMLGQGFNIGQGMDQQIGQNLLQALQAGGNLDSQTAGMLGQLPGMAGMLDEQTMQRMAAALSAAGGIDQQTAGMLGQGMNIASGQQGSSLADLEKALGLSSGQLQDIQNYIGQGRNIIPGVASGISGLAGQYGSAATSAANTASQINSQGGNPFSNLARMFADNHNMFGGGGFGGWGGQSFVAPITNQFTGYTPSPIPGPSSLPFSTSMKFPG